MNNAIAKNLTATNNINSQNDDDDDDDDDDGSSSANNAVDVDDGDSWAAALCRSVLLHGIGGVHLDLMIPTPPPPPLLLLLNDNILSSFLFLDDATLGQSDTRVFLSCSSFVHEALHSFVVGVNDNRLTISDLSFFQFVTLHRYLELYAFVVVSLFQNYFENVRSGLPKQ
jgi:hypothetical protein